VSFIIGKLGRDLLPAILSVAEKRFISCWALRQTASQTYVGQKLGIEAAFLECSKALYDSYHGSPNRVK